MKISECEFNIGDEVIFINRGYTYSTYRYMADIMKINNWKYGDIPSTSSNKIYKITIMERHESSRRMLYCIEELSEPFQGFIVDSRALKITKKYEFLNEDDFKV
jgi:hypothetical protein